MEPWLRDGDRVQVAPARVYWPGDAIAFRGPEGDLRVHRLIGYLPSPSGLRLVAHADAGRGPDVPLALDQVVGRVQSRGRDNEPVRIPLRHRLRAGGRFARLVLRRLVR